MILSPADLHNYTQEFEIAGIHEATGKKRNISLISVVIHQVGVDRSFIGYQVRSNKKTIYRTSDLGKAIDKFNEVQS